MNMARDELRASDHSLMGQRLDYAWKSFESASSRRASFFNFFLILTGILANAFVLSIANDLWLGALVVCIYGAAATAAFIAFDCRYLSFVSRSLRVLEYLERTHYFPDGFEDSDGQIGLARIEPDHGDRGPKWFAKVKFWQRWIIYGIALFCFVLGAVYAIFYHDSTGSNSTLEARVERLEKGIDRLENLDPWMPMEDILPPADNIDGNTNS